MPRTPLGIRRRWRYGAALFDQAEESLDGRRPTRGRARGHPAALSRAGADGPAAARARRQSDQRRAWARAPDRQRSARAVARARPWRLDRPVPPGVFTLERRGRGPARPRRSVPPRSRRRDRRRPDPRQAGAGGLEGARRRRELGGGEQRHSRASARPIVGRSAERLAAGTRRPHRRTGGAPRRRRGDAADGRGLRPRPHGAGSASPGGPRRQPRFPLLLRHARRGGQDGARRGRLPRRLREGADRGRGGGRDEGRWGGRLHPRQRLGEALGPAPALRAVAGGQGGSRTRRQADRAGAHRPRRRCRPHRRRRGERSPGDVARHHRGGGARSVAGRLGGARHGRAGLPTPRRRGRRLGARRWRRRPDAS